MLIQAFILKSTTESGRDDSEFKKKEGSHMKKILALVLACMMLLSVSAFAEEKDPASYSGKVMMYSSAGEDIVLAIKEAFEAKYPNVTLDYYAATSGKCVTKLATEIQAEAVACDVFWPADFSTTISMKNQGQLQHYVSKHDAAIDPQFKDPDG